MNTTPPLYLSYTDADGVLPFFQLLEGKEGFELVADSAAIFKRQFLQLHIRSPRDGDPPIEVACISNHTIGREEAERINQAAINYLMDSGELEKK